MTNLITIQDLNTTINHEPRIYDLRLAEALGFSQTRNIRKLFTLHSEALKTFGELHTVERLHKNGAKIIEYYPNEKQALFICTKSEAANAVDLTIQMVEVFYQFRHGNLQPASPAATLTTDQQRLFRKQVQKRAQGSQRVYSFIYRSVYDHFAVGSYQHLPQSLFQEAMDFVRTMQIQEEKALPVAELKKQEKTKLEEVAEVIWDTSQLLDAIPSMDYTKPGMEWVLRKLVKDAREHTRDAYFAIIRITEPHVISAVENTMRLPA